jgi:hypothetical protein
MQLNDVVEHIQVAGKELVDRVASLIHEGNVRRIIVRDEHGHTYLEIPVTLATVGVIVAPVLAALAAIAALVSKFTIIVERTVPKETPAAPVETKV